MKSEEMASKAGPQENKNKQNNEDLEVLEGKPSFSCSIPAHQDSPLLYLCICAFVHSCIHSFIQQILPSFTLWCKLSAHIFKPLLCIRHPSGAKGTVHGVYILLGKGIL